MSPSLSKLFFCIITPRTSTAMHSLPPVTDISSLFFVLSFASSLDRVPFHHAAMYCSLKRSSQFIVDPLSQPLYTLFQRRYSFFRSFSNNENVVKCLSLQERLQYHLILSLRPRSQGRTHCGCVKIHVSSLTTF